MYKICVLISGNGSNLQSLIDGCQSGVIPDTKISKVISNKSSAYGLIRAQKAGIKTEVCPRSSFNFDSLLLDAILDDQPDLVICAGWMVILSDQLLSGLAEHQVPIINLHPALWGEFPGADGIGEAFRAFQQGRIDRTGVMVHYVIPEMDSGELILQREIPIYFQDSLDSLSSRIKYFEKFVLVEAVLALRLDRYRQNRIKEERSIDIESGQLLEVSYQEGQEIHLISRGKVRDLYAIGNHLIGFETSCRCSSFDRQICQIDQKGLVLNQINAWWMGQTRWIIPNAMIDHMDNLMVMKKCQVIPIEVVIRAYITGNTRTSLWTHYARGAREYCGIKFRDGYRKNQKLDQVVITPTTKDQEHDLPISAEEIVANGICSQEEWDHIAQKSLELFQFASELVEERGLILVDTKLEFGRDQDGQILLIDEAFTCDSSRYWDLASYQDRFRLGLDPDNLDKDLIRNYVKNLGIDPYDPSAEIVIPEWLIMKVEQKYREFYFRLTGKEIFEEQIDKMTYFQSFVA